MTRVRFTSVAIASALLLASATADAVPLTLKFMDSSQQAIGATVAGNGRTCDPAKVVCVTTQDIPTIMSVPGFDPSIGTLLSARLKIGGAFASALRDHAARLYPGGLLNRCVSGGHNATASMGLSATGGLNAIIGASSKPGFSLNANHSYSGTVEDCNLISAQAGVLKQKETNFDFDETFVGADLANFLSPTADIGFFHNPGIAYIDINASHTAPLWMSASSALLSLPTETTPCTSLVSCTLNAALTAVRVLNVLDPHLGGVQYSDMHMSAASSLEMSVEYTYEPFVAVPEPAGFLLLFFGLTGLGLVRRRSQIRLAR